MASFYQYFSNKDSNKDALILELVCSHQLERRAAIRGRLTRADLRAPRSSLQPTAEHAEDQTLEMS